LFVADQLSAECNQWCSMPIRKKAKVPDADKASGQYMQEKAAEELIGGKSHLPLLIPVRVILPAEGHFFAVKT
jgi:hypothetical protein